MKKKIIINEKQLKLIVNVIKENKVQDNVLKSIVTDLDLNYEPATGTHEIGHEFYNTPMISKKVNGETITPKDLYEYLNHKFDGLNKDFLKQVITDWYKGNLKNNGKLTKNISAK